MNDCDDPKILQAQLERKGKQMEELRHRIEAAVTYIEHSLKDRERTWAESVTLQTILGYLVD